MIVRFVFMLILFAMANSSKEKFNQISRKSKLQKIFRSTKIAVNPIAFLQSVFRPRSMITREVFRRMHIVKMISKYLDVTDYIAFYELNYTTRTTLEYYREIHELHNIMRYFPITKNETRFYNIMHHFSKRRSNPLKRLTAYSTHVVAAGERTVDALWAQIFILLLITCATAVYQPLRLPVVVFYLYGAFKRKKDYDSLEVSFRFFGFSHTRKYHFDLGIYSILNGSPAFTLELETIYWFSTRSETFVLQQIAFDYDEVILKYSSNERSRTVVTAEYTITAMLAPIITLTQVCFLGSHYDLFSDIPDFQQSFNVQMLIKKI